MDIAAMSMMLNQSKVKEQAGLSVMKMAMGVEATQADSLTSHASDIIKIMESSVQPYLGSVMDIQA